MHIDKLFTVLLYSLFIIFLKFYTRNNENNVMLHYFPYFLYEYLKIKNKKNNISIIKRDDKI